mmetsp:Transcript_52739/g.125984  ORF Transcript_52739/g.125984 Transcript_52739/m.125984 type:complete len:163 (+) Transcript_52739:300-788(+)
MSRMILTADLSRMTASQGNLWEPARQMRPPSPEYPVLSTRHTKRSLQMYLLLALATELLTPWRQRAKLRRALQDGGICGSSHRQPHWRRMMRHTDCEVWIGGDFNFISNADVTPGRWLFGVVLLLPPMNSYQGWTGCEATAYVIIITCRSLGSAMDLWRYLP